MPSSPAFTLLLSGCLRGPHPWCFNTLRTHLIDYFKPSIYCQIYNDEISHDFFDKFKVDRAIILPKSEKPSFDLPPQMRSFPEVKANNVLYMWRNVMLAFDLASSQVAEGLFMRSRYDIGYTTNVKNAVEQAYTLAPNEILIPSGGDSRGGIFDMFAIGAYQVIRTYCHLYKSIPYYLSLGHPLHSELLLKTHLDLHGIKPVRIDCPIGLCRDPKQLIVNQGNVPIPGKPHTLLELSSL